MILLYGLYKINDSLANYKKAVFYLLRHKELNDSILNTENQQQINELQTKYQSEKKEQENKLLTAKNVLSEQTIKNQKNIAIFLVLGIVLGLLNYFLKPLLRALSLPLEIITLGLFTIVINMALIWLLDMMFDELSVPFFLPLLYTTLIILALNIIISFFLAKK